MGGGGGAGDANNGTGTGGGNGGGIVFILSGGTITGTGTIKAAGNAAANTTTISNGDAAGGGGGGGTIIVYQKNASISNLTIQAKGGNGGNHVILSAYAPETEGPGAGGGGGYIALGSSSGVTLNVSAGANGTTNSTVFTTFTPNGATKGGVGVSNGTAPVNPYSTTSTLPVEFLSFRAMPSNGKILLSWSVASEDGTDYYTIRRKDNSGHETEVCKVKANDENGSVQKYTAVDPNPNGSELYYTLSESDFDGETTDLSTARVSITNKLSQLSVDAIGPNPFDNEIQVSLNTPYASNVLMSLYSMNGQLIEEKTFSIESGTNSLNYNFDKNIPKGNYIIVVKSGDTVIESKKLVKR